ncbi:CocE/NonD family hydrolase [bacterium]|nr:CocE/NonD family hydrolase [bacterium]
MDAEGDMLTSPTPKYELDYRYHVMVPMRDGIRLSTDLAIPRGPGPWPVVITRTPYGNNDSLRTERLLWLARRGFAVAYQDCRGRYDSEGEWEPFRTEREDGMDTLDWLSRQDFCNGSIGVTGRSYEGYNANVLAYDRHPALKAVVPIVALPDPVLNVPYQNGAFFWNMLIWSCMVHARSNQDVTKVNWADLYTALPLNELDKLTGFDSETYQHWMAHPTLDDWWKAVCYMDKWERVDIPALHVCGWYDDDGISTYKNFPGLRAAAKTGEARDGQRLIVGCWPHATNKSSQVGELDFGEGAVIDLNSLIFRFFAKHLAGEDHGLDADPRCRLFIMGENRWHGLPDWPIPGATTTKYYLHSGGDANSLFGDGTLSTSPPVDEPADGYTYDPLNPVPYVTDPVKLQLGEATDQQSIERRPDVLVYTTPPLAEDTVVCGRVFAELYIASDAPGTDFTAKLVDVYQNGMAIQLCDGVQRAEFRESLEQPSWLEAGRVYKLTVDMWATGLRFFKGHRIRLEVSSSAVPKFARHLNTNTDQNTETKPRIARQTVYHDREYPSCLIVDIVPEDALKDTAL